MVLLERYTYILADNSAAGDVKLKVTIEKETTHAYKFVFENKSSEWYTKIYIQETFYIIKQIPPK